METVVFFGVLLCCWLMRIVNVSPPSFPEHAPINEPLTPISNERWQVLCGDTAHWRVGVYSPSETGLDDVEELETHDCPELFVLMEGELTLVLWEDGALRELPLSVHHPVLVTMPHNGYCPGGPHTGTALVVERDRFTTRYHRLEELAAAAKGDR